MSGQSTDIYGEVAKDLVIKFGSREGTLGPRIEVDG